MQIRAGCFLIGLLLFCSVVTVHAVDIPDYYDINGYKEFYNLDEKSAAKKGEGMAQADFGRGVYRFFYYGLQSSNAEPLAKKHLREKHSIYFVPIAGCFTSPGIHGAAEGYNRVMRVLLEKAYSKEIFDELDEYRKN